MANNLLYPEEDTVARKLYYGCRNCPYREVASSPCVYKHEVKQTPNEETMTVVDLSSDPTLPRTTTACPKCGGSEAVYFQSRSRRADTQMTLYYVCARPGCSWRWTS
ncbi:MAG: hypothetical protein DHS80DRAFT_30167 [Piptocephalis tieghemiana]|nr:MAG: hypothetical protein DHS80DRAFT_30167 [Piptocephalis tieghemiana]